MKTKLFHMNGCPHCEKTFEVMDSVEFEPDEKIERSDISPTDRQRYGIHMYPTLVITDDSGIMMDKLEGQLDSATLKAAITTSMMNESIRNYRKTQSPLDF